MSTTAVLRFALEIHLHPIFLLSILLVISSTFLPDLSTSPSPPSLSVTLTSGLRPSSSKHRFIPLSLGLGRQFLLAISCPAVAACHSALWEQEAPPCCLHTARGKINADGQTGKRAPVSNNSTRTYGKPGGVFSFVFFLIHVKCPRSECEH